jgi:bifunctional DNA-binding transcriptional regulator/antitoxin component of YhaV-PrlF toxin-antitoxin module
MRINAKHMGETTIAEVDSRGRVLLSRPLREVLDIHTGDKVRITVEKIIPISTSAKSGMQENPLEAPEIPDLA